MANASVCMLPSLYSSNIFLIQAGSCTIQISTPDSPKSWTVVSVYVLIQLGPRSGGSFLKKSAAYPKKIGTNVCKYHQRFVKESVWIKGWWVWIDAHLQFTYLNFMAPWTTVQENPCQQATPDFDPRAGEPMPASHSRLRSKRSGPQMSQLRRPWNPIQIPAKIMNIDFHQIT